MSRLFFSIALASAILLSSPATGFAVGENWRNRASAEEVVTTGDIAAEINFGRAIAARILGRHKAYDNPALIKYVSLVGATLALSTNRPELEFHMMILDTDELNAYAAPGGYIFITRGALKYMKDESELAGVLAHEIAHITEKHVVKELKIKGTDESSDLAKLAGGSSGAARAAFGQAVEKGLELIFRDEYKKEDEMQADKTSITISALSGYDPTGLGRYLNRIKAIKEKTPPPSDSTHPTFDARVAQINQVIIKEEINYRALAKNNTRFAETINSLK
ncbi:MAG TPA: M48 family metalloprotease [Gallionellaceae bacterium]|nr:M48 family metalloprotease [Gallionellaceae bacterium]